MGVDAEHRQLVMLQVVPVPAFSDNYLWLVHDDESGETAVVDPGDIQGGTALPRHLGDPVVAGRVVDVVRLTFEDGVPGRIVRGESNERPVQAWAAVCRACAKARG